MATEKKLKEIIRNKRGGKWIEYHGPWKIGTAEVWELWTWTNEDGDEVPQTRFWLEDENGWEGYFNYFGDLATYLNKQTEEFKIRRHSLYVASIVFIAAAFAMIACLFTGNSASPLALAAVAGLIPSGAILFFGVWHPITSRRSIPRKSRRPPVQP